MCELNKKNCYIMKQIFNINNEYKLNINEGDYLKLDSKKIFKIDNYDIIIYFKSLYKIHKLFI
jgi:hypothetical protein